MRWPFRLQGYHDQGGNTFLPYDEHGSQKIDLATVLEDFGENSPWGHSHLALNWYFRQTNQCPNHRNIDNCTWQFEIAGENLDLKGGALYPFVVVSDYAPEFYGGNHQPPSSGRYHLHSRPLSAGVFPNFTNNYFSVPSNSGWYGSFSRAGAVSNMPASPDLRAIEAAGISVQGYTSQPTGKLHCRLIQFGS